MFQGRYLDFFFAISCGHGPLVRECVFGYQLTYGVVFIHFVILGSIFWNLADGVRFGSQLTYGVIFIHFLFFCFIFGIFEDPGFEHRVRHYWFWPICGIFWPVWGKFWPICGLTQCTVWHVDQLLGHNLAHLCYKILCAPSAAFQARNARPRLD